MFTLLNPISLWLGALLAVPLAIHFLGRQRLEKIPFPSLLLVQEKFSKSMHRHRLKNLLLLIIRTLLILCLLLALANPVLQGHRTAATKPEASLALIHNGIYGHLHLPSELSGTAPGKGTGTSGATEKDALDRQRLRIRALDSVVGTHTTLIPVIADGSGSQEVSERFGDYGEALTRLLSASGGNFGTAQIHIPVFAWADLAPAQEALAKALQEHPGLQILFADFGSEAANLDAFTGLRTTPSQNAPTVKAQVQLNPRAVDNKSKLQVYLNGRLFQETAPAATSEITLPLGEGDSPRSTGKFSLPNAGFAVADLHFCFPEAGGLTMAHAGAALASLPSLGRETYFRKIIHVASAKDVPWSGSISDKAGKGKISGLRLAYLSDERTMDAAVYARAVEFVKEGGHLILGVGSESDVSMLNRFLLQPMRIGRLGAVADTPSSAAVEANRQALARVGRMPGDLGPLGAVHKRFSFAPDSGTEIVLAQAGEPVLVERDFHAGKVLLWTTDLDDLNWTDVGVSPFTPLLHQAFQEIGSEGAATNLSVASDSVYTVAREDKDGNVSAEPPKVFDPENRPFTKVRVDGARLRIGPFDHLGIHRVVLGRDTLPFAVNLSQRLAGTADWSRWNAENKEAVLNAFKDFRGRVLVLAPDEAAATKAAVRPLWPALLLAAILLLFLEGAISSVFSLRRP